MLREHDRRDDDTTAPAGDEKMGGAPAPRLAGSNVPEDVAFDGAPGGASPPRSVQTGPPGADASQPSETRRGGESPLITAVEIENFKGIGRPVRIELRPITLLFGRNSAGKSTVLHALCYAHEILSHRKVDARKTRLGGDQIDLGGFRRFVHGHDLKRSVRLRFELNLRDRELPELAGARRIASYPGEVDLGNIQTGWIELTVRWSAERNEPILSGYEVGVDGEIVGRITASAGDAEPELSANLEHPMLDYYCREGTVAELEASIKAQRDALAKMARAESQASEKVAPSPEIGRVRETSDPQSFGETLHHMPVRQAGSSSALALPSLGHHLDMELEEGDDHEYQQGEYQEICYSVSALLVGIGGLLRDALARYRYVGPLRDLHPAASGDRGRSVSRRWADGSAAWDLLNRHARTGIDTYLDDWIARGPIRPYLIADVSKWLSQEDRLDTGYALRVRSDVRLSGGSPLVSVLNRELRQYRGILGEMSAQRVGQSLEEICGKSPHDILKAAPSDELAALADEIADAPVQQEVQLQTVGSKLPVRTSDVGVGISQILPVVVAALDPDRPSITAIEQPELHVHPRLQVELGDLFAQGVDQGGAFLVETHSEHLMLRLLRRIEETSSKELPEGKPALKPDQVSVVYVEQVDGEVRATRLRIDETGEFIDRWPQGFFDERGDELF